MSVTIENPAPDSKNSFFLFRQKTFLVNYFQKTIFKSPSEAPFLRKIGKFKIGLNLVEGPMKIMQLINFQSARTKKRKLICSSFLQGLLHISQSYFQAIFYLDLRFLSISFTRAKKVMFRHLLTPWILSYLRNIIASRVYIFIGCERCLLKEPFSLYVILKAFFGPPKASALYENVSSLLLRFFRF